MFDLVASSVLLLMMSPLLVVAAVWVRLAMGRGDQCCFPEENRIVWRSFEIIKFRTMLAKTTVNYSPTLTVSPPRAHPA